MTGLDGLQGNGSGFESRSALLSQQEEEEKVKSTFFLDFQLKSFDRKLTLMLAGLPDEFLCQVKLLDLK